MLRQALAYGLVERIFEMNDTRFVRKFQERIRAEIAKEPPAAPTPEVKRYKRPPRPQ